MLDSKYELPDSFSGRSAPSTQWMDLHSPAVIAQDIVSKGQSRQNRDHEEERLITQLSSNRILTKQPHARSTHLLLPQNSYHRQQSSYHYSPRLNSKHASSESHLDLPRRIGGKHSHQTSAPRRQSTSHHELDLHLPHIRQQLDRHPREPMPKKRPMRYLTCPSKPYERVFLIYSMLSRSCSRRPFHERLLGGSKSRPDLFPLLLDQLHGKHFGADSISGARRLEDDSFRWYGAELAVLGVVWV